MTREVCLKHPLPPDAGPFGHDVDPGDSDSLRRLRSIIDHELGWASPEDEEAGDYEARLREVARLLKSAARSVLQPWLMALGLRHQGVVISGMRGCDTLPKHHPVKSLTRALRCDTLNSFSPNPSSYFKQLERPEFTDLLPTIFKSLDELPTHYVMHLMHASAVVAFYHPDQNRRDCWNMLYLGMVKRFHLHPETKDDLDTRLNAAEEVFALDQD